jgi:hypothetical protein
MDVFQQRGNPCLYLISNAATISSLTFGQVSLLRAFLSTLTASFVAIRPKAHAA